MAGKNSKLKVLSKWALLLVVFGFFMPISCDQNGFELAKYCRSYGSGGSEIICAYLLYILFFAVVISICVSVYSAMTNNTVETGLDLPCLFISIGAGVLAFVIVKNKGLELQMGAFFIILGWVLSLIFYFMKDPSEKSGNSKKYKSDIRFNGDALSRLSEIEPIAKDTPDNQS